MSGQLRPWLPLALLLGASAAVVNTGGQTYDRLLFAFTASSPDLKRFASSGLEAYRLAVTFGYIVGVLLAGITVRRLSACALFPVSFAAAGSGGFLLFFAATRGSVGAVLAAALLSAAQGWFWVFSITLLAEAHPSGRRALSLLLLALGAGSGGVVAATLPLFAVEHLPNWRFVFLPLAAAVQILGFALYWILFRGIRPIAPEWELHREAWSWRDWAPRAVMTGCLLAVVVTVLTSSLWAGGERTMMVELTGKSVTDGSFRIGMLAALGGLVALLARVFAALYGDHLYRKRTAGHALFLLPAMASGPELAIACFQVHTDLGRGLIGAGHGAVTGMLDGTILATVLDATPERNWAKGIALMAITQSLARVALRPSYSQRWLVVVFGSLVFVYLIWAMRVAIEPRDT